jgi:hypothetical protein
LPNVNQSGTTVLTVTLRFDDAGLDIPIIGGEYRAKFLTVMDRYTKGTFLFLPDETLTGVFVSLKTTARQVGSNHRVAFRGPFETEGSGDLLPTGNIHIRLGDQTFQVPAALVAGKSAFVVKKGQAAGISRFSLNSTTRKFRLNTEPVPNTGIPLVGNPAVAHRLPMMIEIPTATGTNVFETVIELKRPTSASPQWSR